MRALSIQVGLILATASLAALLIWRLPVNGWGTLAWLAGVVAMALIRKPYADQVKSNRIVESGLGLAERMLLVAMGVTTAVLPTLHLTTGIFAFADYRLAHWATALGAAILVPALFLFWRSHADLGRNWSVTLELRENHGLVTSGVYRHIRHPMYAAIWLIVLVQPLLVQNWVAGPGAIIAFGLMYAARRSSEEAMMRRRFGPAYDAYARRTGRIWPRLGADPDDHHAHD